MAHEAKSKVMNFNVIKDQDDVPTDQLISNMHELQDIQRDLAGILREQKEQLIRRLVVERQFGLLDLRIDRIRRR